MKINQTAALFTGGVKIPYNEPYRIIWNSTVLHANPNQYLIVNPAGQGASIAPTGYMTDYQILHGEPLLHTVYNDPLSEPSPNHNQPIIYSEVNSPTSVGMHIKNIKKYADSNRRGNLPKVFQCRINHVEFMAPYRLFRYVLDKSGTKYLSVNMIPAATDLEVQLEYCLDGVTVVNERAPIPRVLGTVSDTYRFVIAEDKLMFLYSDPGTELVSLALPRPPVCTSDAMLEIFRPILGDYVPPQDEYVGIDGLIIYDGYL